MKIAFIAMSGIRACDEELLRLGLTLPGFVERSKTIASLPSLGLLTLAGMTPPEHEARYFEIPNLDEAVALPEGFDLVAISSYSAQIDEAYRLAQHYKERGTPVVIGGPHVTALPEEAAAFCTSVVRGEGEPCWLEILADCESGRLKDVYDGRDRNFDLADSPVPAYELLDITKYNRLTVQTSRGCPHRCEFCASSVMIANQYKQKPIENILREIDRIIEIWPQPFIEFADDNSFVNKAFWKELLVEIKKRNFKWFTETDVSISEDEELLDMIREAGCTQVLIGLESPVEAGLKGLELRSDWKHRMQPRYRKAISTIQSHGITVNGCFVIGLDGHTPEIFDSIREFVRSTELYEVQVTILTTLPGTPLYARLEKEGRLIEPTNWKKCTLFDINFHPSGMTAEELVRGFRKLVVDIYSEKFTNWRRSAFRKHRRAYRLQPKG